MFNKKQFNNKLTILAGMTAIALSTATAAQANSFVDFENPEIGDDQSVTNQYEDFGFTFGLDNDLDGVADDGIAPVLEIVGKERGSGGTDGFVNGGARDNDVAAAGFENQLGNYFLRTGGLGGDGGNLLITYTKGASFASGELWDIDGNKNWWNGKRDGGGDRTEQWEVQALGTDNTILDSILSPLGDKSKGGLDGKPWMWSFERDTADIEAIRFVFTGDSRTENVGLAFDNFSTTVAVPEPASALSLLVLGLVGGGSALVKRKAH